MLEKVEKRLRKLRYYSQNGAALIAPGWWFRRQTQALMDNAYAKDPAHINDRLNYYCRPDRKFSVDSLGDHASRMQDIPRSERHTYYFDFYRAARHFDRRLQVAYQFGDVDTVPPVPCLVKSRPICANNANGVLMKWNQVRHYVFASDNTPFRDKRQTAVWRGKAMSKPKRIALLERYHTSDICDVADTDPRSAHSEYAGQPMSIADQLQYRYIISVEGRDVATNLKWILSSRSLCLMPKPRFETWFMEGRLQAGVHYAELDDDFANLDSVIAYYNAHEQEAERIIDNANLWVEQFQHPARERALELFVLHRYLTQSGQLP